MAISSAPWLTNNVRARNSIFYSWRLNWWSIVASQRWKIVKAGSSILPLSERSDELLNPINKAALQLRPLCIMGQRSAEADPRRYFRRGRKDENDNPELHRQNEKQHMCSVQYSVHSAREEAYTTNIDWKYIMWRISDKIWNGIEGEEGKINCLMWGGVLSE